MEETEIDQTQNFHISKMFNFTHYATSLRKFPTETTDLRFLRKFIINYYTKILNAVSLLYSHTIHRNFKVTVLRTSIRLASNGLLDYWQSSLGNITFTSSTII